MQFRAGIAYTVVFLVIAAGAYGVIATAEAPTVTIAEEDADHILEQGDDFTVGETTYNVSELGGDMGTLQHIDDEAELEVIWQHEEMVDLDEEDPYMVYIHDPPEAADDDDDDDNETEEPMPEAFTLIAEFDEEEYETVERSDGLYVLVEENDTEELVHVDDFDEIDSMTLGVEDTVEFYEDGLERQVEGTVADITTEEVTIEYIGEEETTHSLENLEVLTIDGEEFGVYFPVGDIVYLTEDVDSFNAQHDAVADHHERIHGIWWVIAFSVSTVILLLGLAYMPVRG